MADEDLWPKPKYNPGPQKHLHAIGVISTCYNAFEESMFELYRHHPDCLKLPYNLIELYYRSLSEQQRLTALKTVFAEYEKDPSISALVENLIQCFSWCWDVRNKLVHAEHYPALFARPDTLHLTKRVGKKSSEPGYMKLRLDTLRELADKIEFGRKHCARITVYLRIRDIGLGNLSRQYRIYADEPLPEMLVIPDSLELSPRPGVG